MFSDEAGRTIEITNVNATGIESRHGTDLIYYHEPTASFVLVQYKRLDPRSRSVSVDDRLMQQLTKLERARALGRSAKTPDDWRIGPDPCYVKLAYWSEDPETYRPDTMVLGMYLPVSYVRLLLSHKSTLSGRTHSDGTEGRVLGYKQVDRYLTNTHFINLVKNGLVGTVGVTREQLKRLVRRRLNDDQSVLLAVEYGTETTRDRQSRVRKRSNSMGMRHIVRPR